MVACKVDVPIYSVLSDDSNMSNIIIIYPLSCYILALASASSVSMEHCVLN